MTEPTAPLVHYKFDDSLSFITLDDGKANVMSVQMLSEINAALDQAEQNGGVVILTGREKILSGGFDLGVFKRGDKEEIYTMLEAGAKLTHRLLSFPLPTIAACGGHAIAMGTFVLLSCDYRIGSTGEAKFAANEVAIGLTVPHFAIEVCRQRLAPASLNKAVNLAHFFDVDEALQAGFLDEVTSEEALAELAITRAKAFAQLDLAAHAATKLRLRAPLLEALEYAIHTDCEGWRKSYGLE